MAVCTVCVLLSHCMHIYRNLWGEIYIVTNFSKFFIKIEYWHYDWTHYLRNIKSWCYFQTESNWQWSVKACREHTVCQVTLLYIYWRKPNPIWSLKPKATLGHCSLSSFRFDPAYCSCDSCNVIERDVFTTAQFTNVFTTPICLLQDVRLVQT